MTDRSQRDVILLQPTAMRKAPMCSVRALNLALSLVFGFAGLGGFSELAFSEDLAKQGLQVLRTTPFMPADFDEDTLDALWQVWPEPERSQAEPLSGAERRARTFRYYGLHAADPQLPGDVPALGYTRGKQGGWVMNCLSCHGGQVAGQVIPGLPNSNLALQTLVEDVRLVKLQQQKKLTHLDVASLTMPLSKTDGTTNAVMFGVVLGALREPDMTVNTRKRVPEMLHHDVDPPPFWNVRKKTSLYADGFAPKTHRPLMQFMLLPSNSRDTIYQWEDDFRAIQAWIEAVPVPKYPGQIEESLRLQGQQVFNAHCARCHGTYGAEGRYVQQTIPWEDVQTDRLRLEALSPEHRRWMQAGWMSRYGADDVALEPKGYVAPPLDGIWASAPYFHNGSVPTLWHVLHPEQRPVVWRRTFDGYDHERVGLEVDVLDKVPDNIATAAHRRRYFDTSIKGKSAGGHLFPNELTAAEKQAVLEYLKSL